MNWLEALRGTHVGQVAGALGGFTVVRRGRSTHIGPCPACGAKRRHRKNRDRRGAVGLRPDGKGWKCFQCDVGGDALDFISYHLTDRRLRETSGDQRVAVRAWCLQFSPSSEPLPDHGPDPEPEQPPSSGFPPTDEVLAVWQGAGPILEDETLRRWCQSVSIDPVPVTKLDLARALLRGSALPTWARFGKHSWIDLGNRLIVPLYDDQGLLRSLIARFAVKNAIPKTPKSLPPRRFARAGLVMANHFALALLKGQAAPSRSVIVEGEKDFLCAAPCSQDAAVFGIVSGSWSPAIARHIPPTSRVMIATDDDADGDKYARRIVNTLDKRISITRWMPEEIGEDDLL